MNGRPTESGGRLILDGNGAAILDGVGTTDAIVGETALLRTNSDPSSDGGLRNNDDFTIKGRFDLSHLPDSLREAFGIRLTDRTQDGATTSSSLSCAKATTASCACNSATSMP